MRLSRSLGFAGVWLSDIVFFWMVCPKGFDFLEAVLEPVQHCETPNVTRNEYTSPPPVQLRFNEQKLKELRDEEDSIQYRQRAGRLDRWKEMVREAAREKEVDVTPPDSLEHLVCVLFSRFLCNVCWCF